MIAFNMILYDERTGVPSKISEILWHGTVCRLRWHMVF